MPSLPAECRVITSREGIKREDQPLLQIVTKSSKYVETAIRWLSVNSDKITAGRNIAEEDLLELYKILQANISFLQGEYTAVLVKSQFDQDTSKLFKSLEKNNAAFNEQSLANLRAAAEISAARSRSQVSNRGGSHFYGSYSGRGRGYSNRGRNQSDMFYRLANRDIPHNRSNWDTTNTSSTNDV